MLPVPFRAMDPADDLAWLAVADWLEENGESERAELTRLTRLSRYDLHHPDRRSRENRLMELLAAGVEPCVATLTNSIGMEFLYIPAGTFLMGSPTEEVGHRADEGPVHEVEITRGFWMGTYPVTQAEYEAVMEKTPSHFSATGEGKDEVNGMDTSRWPVECVSYKDAWSFCKKLSRRGEEKRQKRAYRLPSEAEWEYSCRAGMAFHPYYFGNSLTHSQANVVHEVRRTTPIGSYPTNAFGLHDMHGNVWEWCADYYHEDYYHKSDKKDPQGPQSGPGRVLRGGSWCNGTAYSRAASRSRNGQAVRSNHYGFRVCFTPAT